MIPPTSETQERSVEPILRHLLESAPDAALLVGTGGRIEFINSRAAALFGYAHDALLGLPVETLMPERHRREHAQLCAHYFVAPIARPMGSTLDLLGRRADGSEFPVEISLSPLESGQRFGIWCAVRDVSARRGIEQALREASRSKSEFLAFISHELRVPLNGLIGFSELLVDEKPGLLNARQRTYVSDILSSARHLLNVVNDLQDLSKVEAGKLRFLPQTFVLAGAIEEVRSVLSPLADEKRVSIEYSVASELASVTLDRQRFIQVLYNLLSNAVKFTDEGGSVRVLIDALPDGQMRLRVCDTGVGIRAEDLGTLFMEFRQLESGAARRYPGSGLGLALTKRIVELQQGTIEVESVHGEGSTFAVTLPQETPQPGA